jgi:hypothetical protein
VTIDPDTLRQIGLLARDDRPLLVLDVDDVLLHFVTPLARYFEHNGCSLRLDTFRLFGNVFEIESVASIARTAEVVLLTAMPHRHRDTRRAFLDRIGLRYPLLTTEMAKGPAIRRLRGETGRAVAFVDDMPHNLASARAAVADASLFHLIADNSLRALLPALPPDTMVAMDWQEAGAAIEHALRS